MKNIIILGAGALAQEVAWLIEEINEKKPTWNLLGFLDDFAFDKNKTILGYNVLGCTHKYIDYKDVFFAIAYGDPRIRERIFNEINGNSLKWATLISPTVRIHKSNEIGNGVIIGRYSDLTVNCKIGDLVYLNIHVVLGHEVEVGNYTIISPNVTVNGGAKIGRACQIGANSFIKDVSIGDFVTVGAASESRLPAFSYALRVF